MATKSKDSGKSDSQQTKPAPISDESKAAAGAAGKQINRANLVGDRHKTLSKKDYEAMERGIESAFARAIQEFLAEDSRKRPEGKKDKFSEKDVGVAALRHAVGENPALGQVLSRINFSFPKTPLSVGLIKQYNRNDKAHQRVAKKLGLNAVNRVRASAILDVMNTKFTAVTEFVDKMVDRKEMLKDEISGLSLCEESFYFMMLYLFSKSEKGGFSEDKLKKREAAGRPCTWEVNIPKVLYFECCLALLHVSTPLSKALLECWMTVNEQVQFAEDLLLQYPDGVFYPIITKTISPKGNVVSLRSEQKVWVKQIEKYVNSYCGDILSGKFKSPQVFVNSATMGAGKTSVCALASTQFVDKVNAKLGPKKKRLVQIFVVPSKEVLVSFGTLAANYVSTWLYQAGRLEVMHKYSPEYNTGIRKYPRAIERWTKYLRDSGLPVAEQVHNLLNWHLLHKKERRDKRGRDMWVHGKDRYQPPSVIFCDPSGAFELLENEEEFKQRFGWHFLPVIDEFVATADCKFTLEENQYIRTLNRIITMGCPYMFLMSASVKEQQMRQSSMFGPMNLEFAPTVASTNSLTQMFVDNGSGREDDKSAVHPFSALTANNIDASIASWDETQHRCITPTILIKICKKLGFTLEWERVRSPQKYMKTVQDVLDLIKGCPMEVKQWICNINLSDVAVQTMDKRAKTLTLTSGSLMYEILGMLGEKRITIDTIKQEQKDYVIHANKEIAKLEKEIELAKRDKERSREGSADEIKARIEFLKNSKTMVEEQIYYLSTDIGSVSISGKWVRDYAEGHDALTPDELAAVLSGAEVFFDDPRLDEPLRRANPKQVQIIDTISSMYGRNDPRVQNVVVHDSEHRIGLDTLAQAFARAGRSGVKNCVVMAIIDPHLLECFRAGSASSVSKMDIYIKDTPKAERKRAPKQEDTKEEAAAETDTSAGAKDDNKAADSATKPADTKEGGEEEEVPDDWAAGLDGEDEEEEVPDDWAAEEEG
mmetsp:Transcript_27237/g.52812  ORF Transcript_27237/g.52812 Transcript_27237/m.52812 type:complete len:993 (+) Transcript_27237:54-3032(+)